METPKRNHPPTSLEDLKAPRPTFLFKWFNDLEAIATKEAEVAGLLSHRASVGTAREFADLLPESAGHFSEGFHDGAFWRSVAPAQVAQIATAMT